DHEGIARPARDPLLAIVDPHDRLPRADLGSGHGDRLDLPGVHATAEVRPRDALAHEPLEGQGVEEAAQPLAAAGFRPAGPLPEDSEPTERDAHHVAHAD